MISTTTNISSPSILDKIDKNSDTVQLHIQPELLLTGNRTITRKCDSYTVNGINLFIKKT